MDVVLGWLEKFATGKRRKIFWATALIVLLLLWAVYPFVDARFFVHNRVSQRIENLGNLVEIEGESIEDSSSLLAEYNSIVHEIDSARIVLDNGIFYRNDTTSEFRLKFIGGALLGIIIAIWGFFSKDPDMVGENKWTKLAVVSIGLIIGGLLGFLFSLLPVFGSAWVNLVAAPIIQIVIMAILFSD